MTVFAYGPVIPGPDRESLFRQHFPDTDFVEEEVSSAFRAYDNIEVIYLFHIIFRLKEYIKKGFVLDDRHIVIDS